MSARGSTSVARRGSLGKRANRRSSASAFDRSVALETPPIGSSSEVLSSSESSSPSEDDPSEDDRSSSDARVSFVEKNSYARIASLSRRRSGSAAGEVAPTSAASAGGKGDAFFLLTLLPAPPPSSPSALGTKRSNRPFSSTTHVSNAYAKISSGWNANRFFFARASGFCPSLAAAAAAENGNVADRPCGVSRRVALASSNRGASASAFALRRASSASRLGRTRRCRSETDPFAGGTGTGTGTGTRDAKTSPSAFSSFRDSRSKTSFRFSKTSSSLLRRKTSFAAARSASVSSLPANMRISDAASRPDSVPGSASRFDFDLSSSERATFVVAYGSYGSDVVSSSWKPSESVFVTNVVRPMDDPLFEPSRKILVVAYVSKFDASSRASSARTTVPHASSAVSFSSLSTLVLNAESTSRDAPDLVVSGEKSVEESAVWSSAASAAAIAAAAVAASSLIVPLLLPARLCLPAPSPEPPRRCAARASGDCDASGTALFAAGAKAVSVSVSAGSEETSGRLRSRASKRGSSARSPPERSELFPALFSFSFSFSRFLAARLFAASTSGARLKPLPALLCRNPCGSSSAASGLLRASFCRHRETKFLNESLHLSASRSAGAGSAVIMKMTRMGCTSCLGGFTSAISIALTPSAQTSTLPSYFDS
mmetsp:Transcript_10969/g.46846  ORF Transcript_10969/g.46846 Transcript_10969/m.46846 type:complete len:657 (-) Transcript_10969:592-2562(-)